MGRCLAWVGLLSLAAPLGGAEKVREIEVSGYLEWRQGELLVVDGQRVRPVPLVKFKGKERATDVASIPLGYEVEAKGTRGPGGVLLARELEAKPNDTAMWENEVLEATREAEASYLKVGHMFQRTGDGRVFDVGRLYEDGPQVDRVRRIVAALVPPYLTPGDFRVYVVDNKEWNAAAMGNKSIYVYTGLLGDLDDDEVAIVLGHEMAHATYEHSRKQAKKQMWANIGIATAAGATERIDNKQGRAAVALVVGLGGLAWSNGYGRDLEDQADRVGLRYAYEGGFDITKGPRLWRRFAQKYGESNKVENFFFGDHSLSSARATKLDRELAYNYAEGPRKGATKARAVYAAAAALPAAGRNRPSAAPRALAPPVKTEKVDLKPGMTPEEVRGLLGNPSREAASGRRAHWAYPDMTVVFENGRVKEVRF